LTRGAFAVWPAPGYAGAGRLALPLLDDAQERDNSIDLRHLHRAHLPLGFSRGGTQKRMRFGARKLRHALGPAG